MCTYIYICVRDEKFSALSQKKIVYACLKTFFFLLNNGFNCELYFKKKKKLYEFSVSNENVHKYEKFKIKDAKINVHLFRLLTINKTNASCNLFENNDVV